MNVWRGTVRSYILLSTAWVAWAAYQPMIEYKQGLAPFLADEQTALKQDNECRQLNAEDHLNISCDDYARALKNTAEVANSPISLIYSGQYRTIATRSVVPIVVGFLILLFIRWVVRGFAPPRAPDQRRRSHA